ncbi:MAG TPA: type III secretion T3S chaperone [Rhabdochlamydiaceae bacterium]|jgi:flagellar biosynthesis chaperone FliJ
MSEPYPLEQLVLIKQKKLEEAEKNLREKKRLLEEEENKLRAVEKERDKVKDHRFAKLTQLREKMDEGAPSDKIQQMRYYLKEVDQQLAQKEVKVVDQKKRVEAAQRNVELARLDLLKKQQDVEKLRMHREEWEKEMKAIAAQKEGVETDEMGSALHNRKTRGHAKKPKKNKNN